MRIRDWISDVCSSVLDGPPSTRFARPHPGEKVAVERGRVRAEAAEDDPREAGMPREPVRHRPHGDARGAVGREAVDAGRDGGEGDAGEAVRRREVERIAIAAFEQTVLARAAALP